MKSVSDDPNLETWVCFAFSQLGDWVRHSVSLVLSSSQMTSEVI